MTRNAIDQFETAKRFGRHYITFQADAKRLTKMLRRKDWRNFSPPAFFYPVGEVGLALIVLTPIIQTGITKFQSASTGSGILAHFLAGTDTIGRQLQLARLQVGKGQVESDRFRAVDRDPVLL